MVTVLRGEGLRVVIFADDHAPAHVHAFGDEEAKVDLGADGEGVKLVWAVGMTRTEVRRTLKLVEEHRGELIERWMAIHGRNHGR